MMGTTLRRFWILSLLLSFPALADYAITRKSLGVDPTTGTEFIAVFDDPTKDVCWYVQMTIEARVPGSLDIDQPHIAEVVALSGAQLLLHHCEHREHFVYANVLIHHPSYERGAAPAFEVQVTNNRGHLMLQITGQRYEEERNRRRFEAEQAREAQQAAEERRRQAAAEHERWREEQDRRQQALFEAKGAQNKRLAEIREFQQRHPDAEDATVEALFANPYAFVGRSLMIRCGFAKALDPTSLLFESLREGSIEMVVVDASPSIAQQFTKPHLAVVLALRVTGVRALQYAGGDINFPRGELLGVLSGAAVEDWETAQTTNSPRAAGITLAGRTPSATTLDVKIDGEHLIIDGTAVTPPVRRDVLFRVLGKPSRSSRSSKESNTAYVWDAVGLYALEKADTDWIIEVTIVVGEMNILKSSVEYWPQKTFSGELRLDGAEVIPQSTVEGINRVKKGEPLKQTTALTWSINYPRLDVNVHRVNLAEEGPVGTVVIDGTSAMP